MRQFCIGLMLLVAALCLADAEPKVPHTVKSGGMYYFALPAKQIAYGMAAMVTSGEDGRYLAYVLDTQTNRDPTALSETENMRYFIESAPSRGLWVYNRSLGQAEMILALNDPKSGLDSISWLEGSSLLVINQSSEETAVTSIYNPQTKRTFQLQSSVPNASRKLYALPKQNACVLISHQYQSAGGVIQYVEVFDAQFRPVRAHKLSANFQMRLEVRDSLVVASRYNREKRGWDTFEFNLQTAGLTPIQLPDEGEIFSGLVVLPLAANTLALIDVERSNELMRILESRVTPSSTTSDPQETSVRANAYAELEKAGIILTTEGTTGSVIGKYQAVWHLNRSGLFLTELLPLSASQYEELLIQRIKLETISRAKQVGVAMMIYGSDYDDALPLAQDWQEALYPYMKNSKLVEGFVYMMNGENMGEIDDITGTILGFIETPYGTAYVRADNSVIWKDKPKPVAYLRSLEALRN